MNLVLIDSRITDIESIQHSFTENTRSIVFDFQADTYESIQSKIIEWMERYGSRIEQIAIIQHNYFTPEYFFLNSANGCVLENVDSVDPNLYTWQKWIKWLEWLRDNTGAEYFDLLACDVWSSPNWKYIIREICAGYNIHIRASLDITGKDGNFILESDNVDTVGLYFTEDILQYKYNFTTTATGATVSFIEAFPHANRYQIQLSNLSQAQKICYAYSTPFSTNTGVVPADTNTNPIKVSIYGDKAQNNSINVLDMSKNKVVTVSDLSLNTSRTNQIVCSNDGHIFLATKTNLHAYKNNNSNFGSIVVPENYTITHRDYSYSSINAINTCDIILRCSYDGNRFAYMFTTKSTIYIGTLPTDTSNITFTAKDLTFLDTNGASYMDMSRDGRVIIISPVTQSAKVIVSIDFGVNWEATNLSDVNYVCCSKDGNVLFAMKNNDFSSVYYYILSSNLGSDGRINFGNSWSTITHPSNSLIDTIRNNHMCANYDGTILYVGERSNTTETNKIYIAKYVKQNETYNYQQRWIYSVSIGNKNTSNTYLTNIRCSDNGSIVSVVCPFDFTAISIDGGYTWNSGTLLRFSGCLSNDGKNNYIIFNTIARITRQYFSASSVTTNIYLYNSSSTSFTDASNIRVANNSYYFSYDYQYVPDLPIINNVELTSGTPRSITVSFSQPTNTGSSAITNYKISTNNTDYTDISTTSSPFDISGLSYGVSYYVYLKAKNSQGTSYAAIYPTSVTIQTIPPAIPQFTANMNANSDALIISFQIDNGGASITSYKYSLNGGSDIIFTPIIVSTYTYTISSGYNIGSNTITLKVTNSQGTTISPSVSFTYTPPSPPTVNNAVGQNQKIYLYFTEPVTIPSGRTIATYLYSTDNGSTYANASTTISPLIISKLSSSITTSLVNNTTYPVRLKAEFENGSYSGVSDPVISVTPVATPEIPNIDNNTSMAGYKAIQIFFTTTTINGVTITDYEYSTNGTNYASMGTTQSPYTIRNTSTTPPTDLQNGTSYPITIRAKSSAGYSIASTSITRTPLPNVPEIPIIDTIVAGYKAIQIYFTTTPINGVTITDYEYSTNGTNYVPMGTIQSPYIITNTSTSTPTTLQNGISYPITIRAKSSDGYSIPSTSQSVTPSGAVPNIPTINNTVIGNKSIQIYFTTADATGVTITDYEYSTNGADYVSMGTIQSPYIITNTSTSTPTNLQNGTSYPITIRAKSSAGYSIPSTSQSITPSGAVPNIPTINNTVIGNKAIQIYFTTADATGVTITDYEYSTNGTNYVPMGTIQSPYIIKNPSNSISSDLQNGTSYPITIRAKSSAGYSIPSTSQSVTPSGDVPNIPIISNTVVGNKSIQIFFNTEPVGGVTISDYEYSTNGADYVSMGTTQSPYTIQNTSNTPRTDLQNETTYPITIRAKSSVGYSIPSISQSAKPIAIPNIPTINNTVVGNKSIQIYFTTADATGVTISDYEYSTNGADYVSMGTTQSPYTIQNTSNTPPTNLQNETSYPITIRAKSSAGYYSIPSTSQSGTPSGAVPNIPTISNTVLGNKAIQIYFTTADATGVTITDYEYSTNGTNYVSMGTTQSPYIIRNPSNSISSNLQNEISYPITIRAKSSAGYSIPSISIAKTPSSSYLEIPRIITSVAGNKSIQVLFEINSNVIYNYSYTYEYSTDGTNYSSMNYTVVSLYRAVYTITHDTVNSSELLNGTTYSISIRTKYSGNVGLPSTIVSNTPSSTSPGMPTITSAAGGRVGEIQFAYTLPSENVQDIIGYEYSVDEWENFIIMSSDNPYTTNNSYINYNNNTAYRIIIRSFNSNGAKSIANVYFVNHNDQAQPIPTLNSAVLIAYNTIMVDYTNTNNAIKYQYSINNLPYNDIQNNNIITGLPSVTNDYIVRIRAVYTIGNVFQFLNNTAYSFASNSITVKSLLPPVITDAVGQDKKIVVYFTEPGIIPPETSIVSYWYSTNNGIDYVSVSTPVTSPIIITKETVHNSDLINGVPYSIKLKAKLSDGTFTEPSVDRAPVIPYTIPDRPIVTLKPKDTSIEVTVTNPGSNGGKDITGYYYTASSSGASDISGISSLIDNKFTITGLTNGKTYSIKVKATNNNGSDYSYESINDPETPNKVTYAPTSLSLTSGNNYIEVSFKKPESNGGTTNTYTIYVNYPNDDTKSKMRIVDVNPSESSTNYIYTERFTDLNNGTEYTINVTSNNNIGPSVPVTDTATPYTIPDQPNVTLEPKDTTIEVTVTNPSSNGGKDITAYRINWSFTNNQNVIETSNNIVDVNNLIKDGSTYKYIIDGLINGKEYSVTAEAKNDDSGDFSLISQAKQATPYTVPGKPSIILIPENKFITVTVTPPTSDGGRPITEYHYTVSYLGGSPKTGIPELDPYNKFIIPDLSNGITYSVFVQAKNDNSEKFSEKSNIEYATPYTIPDPPTISLIPGNQTIELHITPGDNGGNAIKQYIIYVTDTTTDTIFSPITLTDTTTYTTTYTIGVNDVSLTNYHEYDVYIVAVNDRGNSDPSTTYTATPVPVPDPPTHLFLYPRNRYIDISFNASSTANASNVMYYNITITLPGDTAPPIYDVSVNHVANQNRYEYSTLNKILLTNGVNYQVNISAVNSIGMSSPLTGNVIPCTVPDAPTDLLLTPGNNSIALSFKAPMDNGGNPIIKYIISDGVNTYNKEDIQVGRDQTYTISNLLVHREYTISVIAVNAVGESTAVTNTETPYTVPDAPTNLYLTPGDNSIDVSFNTPTETGGRPVNYIILLDGVGITPFISVTNDNLNTFTIPDLTVRKLYTISVRSNNSVGPSLTDISGSSMPFTIPDAPSDLLLTPGNNSIALSFKAPMDNGGKDIIKYIISDGEKIYNKEDIQEGSNQTYTISNLLVHRQYTISVIAVNAVGQSTAVTNTATPYTVPDAPTDLLLTPGNNSIALSFKAPMDNGGNPIIKYIISDGVNTYNKEDIQVGRDQTYTISNLLVHREYTISVIAVNAVGESTAVTNTETPYTVPDAPTNLYLTPGDNSIDVSFNTPTETGGRPVNYIILLDGVGITPFISVTNDNLINTFTLYGLTVRKLYTISVRSNNSVGPSLTDISGSSMPFTIPDAPSDLLLTPGDNSIDVSFNIPVETGGRPITDYIIFVDETQYTPDSIHTSNGKTTFTVTNLFSRKLYTISVRSANSIGRSLNDISGSAMPFTIPYPPNDLLLTPGNNSIDVSFNTPTETGGRPITGYIILLDGEGITPNNLVTNDNQNTFTIDRLIIRKLYTISVKAVNSIGPSLTDISGSSMPFTIPDAPTNLLLTPGNNSIDVSFNHPIETGGTPIIDCNILVDEEPYDPSNLNISNGKTTFTVTPLLTRRLYTISVNVVNAVGPSLTDISGSAMPFTIPDAPTDLSLNPQDSSIIVSFNAPAETGGTPIRSYNIYSNGNNVKNIAVNNDPIIKYYTDTIGGLENGTKYNVYVKAVNDVGESTASNTLESTPYTNPGPPKDVILIPANRSITVSFKVPDTNGGRPIQKYVIFVEPSGSEMYTIEFDVIEGYEDYAYIIDNLQNKYHTVYVKAVQDSGLESANSGSKTERPLYFPDTPIFDDPLIGNGSVQLYIQNYTDDIESYSYSITVNNTDIGSGIWTNTNTIPINPITISGLTNDQPNTISIRAKNVDGFSSAKDMTVTPRNAYPLTPEILWSISGETGIQLGVNILKGYSYAYSTNGENYTDFTIDQSDNKFIIEPLFPNTQYTVYLKTKGDNNTYSVPYVYNITTREENTNISYKPPIINSIIPGKNAVQLYITYASDRFASKYKYIIGSISNLQDISYQDLHDSIDGPVTIIVSPNGEYSITLVATYDNGEQTFFSNTKTVTTLDTIPETPTLSNFTFIPGYKAIRISFDETEIQNGTIQGYIYSLDNGITYSDDIIRESPYIISTIPNTLELLDENAEYTIRIKSVNDNGVYSIWSDKKTVQLSPNIPGTPAINTITPGSNQIQITYLAPVENTQKVTGYEYSIDGGNSFVSMGLTNPYIISELSNNVQVELCIRTRYNDDGSVFYSIPTSFVSVTPQAYYYVGIPTLLDATSGSEKITITYEPPSVSTTGLLRYQYSTTNGLDYNDISGDTIGDNGRFTYTIVGLDNDVSYNVRIRAVYQIEIQNSNQEVYSFASNVKSVRTVYTKSDPPILDDVITGNQSATLYFRPPEYKGGRDITIAEYLYSYDGVSFTAFISSTEITNPENASVLYIYTITGLTNGTRYTVYLRAKNSKDLESENSNSISFTPYTKPNQPIYKITPLDKSVKIDILNSDDNGGDTITKYTFYYSNVNTEQGYYDYFDASFTSDNSYIIPYLENGAVYDIYIVAYNNAGPSENSLKQTVTPYTIPDPPINLTLSSGYKSIDVSFQSPVSNGGNTITKYNIFVDPSTNDTTIYTLNHSIDIIQSETPPTEYTYTIDTLIPGVEYRVVVNAVNSAGPSAFSLPVSAIPFSKPDPPIIGTIVDGSGISTVDFTPGNSNGTELGIYEYSINNKDWAELTEDQMTDGKFMLSDLSNGVQYGIRMRVNSNRGFSPPSDIVYCRPFTNPDAPRIEKILAKNWKAIIEYNLVNTNGRDVTDIYYSLNRQSPVANGVPSTLLIPVLNYNKYTIRIRTKNEAGFSEWSSEWSFEPYYLNTELPLIKKSFTGNSSLTKAQLYAMTVRNAKGNVKNLYK